MAGDRELQQLVAVERLDYRDLGAVRELAAAWGVSVVIGSDLCYEDSMLDAVAAAAAAALPCGGHVWLLLPTRYRRGMSRMGFARALTAAGLQGVEARPVAHEGVHDVFAACEDEPEYCLFEACLPT